MDEKFRMIMLAAVAIIIIGTGIVGYYAITNKPMHTVTIEIMGNGKVQLGTMGTYLTSMPVKDGDSLRIAASPDPGWKFIQWSGDLSGNTNPMTIIVTKDLNIFAIFTK